MSSATSSLVAGCIGLLIFYLFRRRSSSSSLPLPPGPPGLPIIGNVHQAPKSHAWLQFAEWGKQYGPIFYLNMLGQHVVVLSTSKTAYDLLSKRGATFSDRAPMFFAGELAHKNLTPLFFDYNDDFRGRQRLENIFLNPNAAARYRPLQHLESKQLLRDLLKKSDESGNVGINPHGPVEREVSSSIGSVFYAFRLKHDKEPDLLEAVALDEEFSEFVKPGAHLVDTFPALNILPGPLAPWKAEAESHFQRKRALHTRNLDRGLTAPGWTFAKQSQEIIKKDKLPISPLGLAFELGGMGDAAVGTTVETISWLIYACVTHDNGFVQAAQRELDEVVGRDRLPSFEDQAGLLYISAIVEELLRWRPAVAGGIPHYTKVESTYEGYRIPAGTVVIPSHWAITREEGVYGPEPESFRPERWIDAEGEGNGRKLKDLHVAGFGYGRRICPGRHFARNMVWISIAHLLWAFEFKPGLSETGEAIPIDTEGSTGGVLTKPPHFKARLIPRDQAARDIIEGECDTHGVDITPMLTDIGQQMARK